MPYTPVLDVSRLKPLSLTKKSAETYCELEDLDNDLRNTGPAGLINKLPPGEAFRRHMKPPKLPKLRNPRDLERLKKHINKEKEKHRKEADLSENTLKAIQSVFSDATSIFMERVHRVFDKANEQGKRDFIHMCVGAEAFLHSDPPADDKTVNVFLEILNESMTVISRDPQVPDKLHHICEAIYTMATADKPHTYAEALAKVGKTKLIAPNRGGTGEVGM